MTLRGARRAPNSGLAGCFPVFSNNSARRPLRPWDSTVAGLSSDGARRSPDGLLEEVNSVLRTDLVCIIGTLVALSLMPAVYAADKFPDYPVREAGDYAVTAVKAEFSVGVQPVEDLKEQKTYFHTELTPKGFIPVFVVMQNGSSGDSFLFDKTKVAYGSVDSTASSPKVGSKTGEVVEIASLLVYSPIGIFAGLKLMADASRVQQNILKNEVQSKTLSPGGSVHGFLYVPVPKKGSRQKMHLQVPVTRTGTDETFVVDLFF